MIQLNNMDTQMNDTEFISRNISLCIETTTPVYDHQGAMKFTVAVVLVYGIGVIGILGIYVRRKPSESQERHARVVVQGLRDYKERVEKEKQLSSVHDLIKSIHGEGWKYSPTSSGPSTPVMSPALGQKTFKQLDNRSVGSPVTSEGVPLLSGHRRPVLNRSFPSFTTERQDSIPETAEEEEENSSSVLRSPESEFTLGRAALRLQMPPSTMKETKCLSSKDLTLTPREDNSTRIEISDEMGTEANRGQVCPPAKHSDGDNLSEAKANGRFTVVNVEDV